ncbi:hypothetical protein KDA23_01675 [Candidatus Saccharibacteria bacterium]|nr:hypothetical protein [Candidatus Saccharibacteria bacterium]
MKQKDIAMIVLIIGIAGIASFFVSKAIFASASAREQKAEVVDAITTTFTLPSDKYFNENSIDPTQLIQIGDGSNNNPFDSRQ